VAKRNTINWRENFCGVLTDIKFERAYAAIMATAAVIAAVVAAHVAATKQPAFDPGTGNPGVQRARKRRGSPWESSYAQMLLASLDWHLTSKLLIPRGLCCRQDPAAIARGMPYWVSKKPKDATGVDHHQLEM
jgi:hypothetical protein